MSQSLTTRTLNGFTWSTASMVANSVVQIGYMAIMSRLLEPAAFGLVAMAGIILRFGSYFANMGMGQALIQKKELENEDIRAAFTSSLLLGLFFGGGIYLLAPLALYIFDDINVIHIIRVMSLSFLFTSLNTTSVSLLRRRLEFRLLSIVEIFSYVVVYAGTGITLAINGFGVWSIVFAGLSQSLSSAILLYLLVRHDIRLLFNWNRYKPLLSFGGRISFIGFLEFLGSNLDKIAIGHFLGAGMLGLYDRIFILIQMPIQNLTSSISKVLFPALSTIQSETKRLKNIYLSSISLVGYVIIPACVGASVAADELVLVLLGEKWATAIPVFQILAFVTPLNLLSHFGGVVCEARGVLNAKVWLQVIYFMLLAVLFYSFNKYGLIGFAYSLLIAEFIRHISYIFITHSFLQYKFGEAARSYFPPIISAIIIGVAMYLLKQVLIQLAVPMGLRLTIEIPFGALLLIMLMFFNFNRSIRIVLNDRLISKINLFQGPFFANFFK